MSNKEQHELAQFDGIPFEMLNFSFSASVGYVSNPKDVSPLSDYVDEDYWNSLTYQEKQEELDEIADKMLSNCLDVGYGIVL